MAEVERAAGGPGLPPDAVGRAGRLGSRLLLMKAVVLVALALAGAWLARLPSVRAWMAPAGELAATFRDLGWGAVPVFLAGSAVLIAVGVPRLVFCPLAGAVFGFWGGLGVSTLATMGAYLGSFVFIRGRLADAEVPYELPPRLAFLKVDPGVSGVVLTRLLPIPGLIGTIALALSPVRKRAFLLGSLIGLVPEAVPLILLGAGLFEGNPKQLAWLGAGALLLIVVSVLLIRRLLKRHALRMQGPPAPSGG